MLATATPVFPLAAVPVPPSVINSQLSEKPHQGVATSETTSHHGWSAANSLNASGIEECLYDSGRRTRSTGKERDAESGLDFFGARYLSAAQGRFTSPDPHNILTEASSQEEFTAFISNPQNWNRYAYVVNNPLSFTDPDGRYCPQCLIWLQQLAQRATPYVNRAAAAAQQYGRQAYIAATRFFSSPTGQEITQTVAETALGYQGPSFNPIRAAENFGLRGISAEAGLISGKLANGAEVWAGFEKTGQNFAVNILGAFNPADAKGSLGTLKSLMEGAVNAARAEGATSVTLRGVAVVNDRLGALLQKQGFKLKKFRLPDGSEVDAYELTFGLD